MPLSETLRRQTGALLADGFFRTAARLGQLHPASRPERHDIERLRDIAYHPTSSPEHTLDVYRPQGPGPHPVVLYVHGGGFRILSKDTHWIMALAFARQGFIVFNVNYRLAPRHPFPAGIEDICRAHTWVVENAADYGGDPAQITLAGESAGANLVSALALALCYERDEPFAQEARARGPVPQAVLAACGVFQVSDPGRFSRRRPLSRFIQDRLDEPWEAYLRPADPSMPTELADPLVLLERDGVAPIRPLPPFFLPVGTRDPLLDDTRRMHRALTTLGVRAEARYYPGEIHAFHAFVMRRQARRCWRDMFEFLQDVRQP